MRSIANLAQMKKVRGTRDILCFFKYTEVCNTLKSILLLHNFQEIHTPIFEYEEVFTKTLGDSTDIVNKEMYYISHKHELKKTDEKKIVLRPEMTASVMRSYFENNILDTPWKTFQIGSLFRHERPQKGRYREFFQCNIECINATSIGNDIQFIYLLKKMFDELIPKLFSLKINYIGTSEERNKYKKELYAYCLENKLEIGQERITILSEKNILRILDTKNEKIQKILSKAPCLTNFLSEKSKEEWNTIQRGLSSLNVSYIHDHNLVRGLDYYNGIVFEFISTNLGAQNSFCGGGRYDSLSKNFKKDEIIPSVGAAIGVDRLLMIIDEQKNDHIKKPSKYTVIFDTQHSLKEYSYAIKVQEIITSKKYECDVFFDKKSLKSALKKSNNEKIDIAFIIRKNDPENKTILLKEMEGSRKQYEVSFDEIKNIIT